MKITFPGQEAFGFAPGEQIEVETTEGNWHYIQPKNGMKGKVCVPIHICDEFYEVDPPKCDQSELIETISQEVGAINKMIEEMNRRITGLESKTDRIVDHLNPPQPEPDTVPCEIKLSMHHDYSRVGILCGPQALHFSFLANSFTVVPSDDVIVYKKLVLQPWPTIALGQVFMADEDGEFHLALKIGSDAYVVPTPYEVDNKTYFDFNVYDVHNPFHYVPE